MGMVVYENLSDHPDLLTNHLPHVVKVNSRKYIRIHHTATFYVSENHGDILPSYVASHELEIINSRQV